MNISDVKKGMILSIEAADTKTYKAEVSEVTSDGILVQALKPADDFFDSRAKDEKYEVCIVVDNALYMWQNIKVTSTKKDGFAISSPAQEFADVIGKQIEIEIQGFDLLNGKSLRGIVTRCTEDEGKYIMGCRMPENNAKIGDYVKSKLSKSDNF